MSEYRRELFSSTLYKIHVEMYPHEVQIVVPRTKAIDVRRWIMEQNQQCKNDYMSDPLSLHTILFVVWFNNANHAIEFKLRFAGLV